MNEFDHMPKINQNFSHRTSLDGMSEQGKPVYDKLIQKGRDYQMKNEIKINLEKNMFNEECTFRPQLNSKSIELGSNHTKVGLDLYNL